MDYDRSVYRTTLEVLKKHFPFAFQSLQNRRVLDLLIFGERDEWSSERVVVSHKKLFELTNDRGLKSAGNFSSGEFLKEYMKNLGVGYNLSEYSHQSGYARTIEIAWPREVKTVLGVERRRKLRGEERIGLLSETLMTERKLRELMNEESRTITFDPNRLNAPIMQYLCGISPQTYYRYVDNIPRARAHLLETNNKSGMIDSQLDVLNELEDRPKPFYRQVDTTERIYAKGLSLQNLNKDLRRIVLHDCMVADLKSCHLAIVAYDWKLPELKDFLVSGESFWTMILHDLGLPNTAQEKSSLKNALYAMVYGAEEKTIKGQLQGSSWARAKDKKAVKAVKKDKKEFLQHPYIQLILNRRAEVLDQIKADRGVEIMGQFCPMQHDGDEKSLLARRSQAIETYVIGGAYEYAQENPKRVKIISHEHDGFSAQLKNPSQKNRTEVQWGMSERVERRAAEMGIRLELEYQLPDEAETVRAM